MGKDQTERREVGVRFKTPKGEITECFKIWLSLFSGFYNQFSEEE